MIDVEDVAGDVDLGQNRRAQFPVLLAKFLWHSVGSNLIRIIALHLSKLEYLLRQVAFVIRYVSSQGEDSTTLMSYVLSASLQPTHS